MRPELQTVLDSLPELPPSELPELLGELEVIRATATLRMSAPPPMSEDRLIGVKEAAERLGWSTDYLYAHAAELPFTHKPPDGRKARKVQFSSLGIDAYIRGKNRKMS